MKGLNVGVPVSTTPIVTSFYVSTVHIWDRLASSCVVNTCIGNKNQIRKTRHSMNSIVITICFKFDRLIHFMVDQRNISIVR